MSKKRNPINESELMELMAGKREEISVVKDSAKTSEPIKDEIVSDNKTQNIEPANMLKPEQKASTSTRLKKTDVETYESLFLVLEKLQHEMENRYISAPSFIAELFKLYR